MFLLDPLQKMGLSEKQAKVYLATLELGGDKVPEIAKKAGLKRPTVYVLLEDLKQKGLIFQEKKTGADIYTAVGPDALRHMLEDRRKSLEEALPFLRALYTGEKSKPQVQVFEGIDGIKQSYYETLWKSKTPVWFFSSIKKIYEVFPEILDGWLSHLSEHTANHVQSREIINPDPIDIEYGLKALKQNPKEEVRVLPAHFSSSFLTSDNAILDDKIVMVSLEGKLFTTVIQSKVLADTMRTLYELAWQSAVPLREFVKQHPECMKMKK